MCAHACRIATTPNGALAVSQCVVDVKHRLSMQEGAFMLYVESAVPLFALALKVGRTLPVPLGVCIARGLLQP